MGIRDISNSNDIYHIFCGITDLYVNGNISIIQYKFIFFWGIRDISNSNDIYYIFRGITDLYVNGNISIIQYKFIFKIRQNIESNTARIQLLLSILGGYLQLLLSILGGYLQLLLSILGGYLYH